MSINQLESYERISQIIIQHKLFEKESDSGEKRKLTKAYVSFEFKNEQQKLIGKIENRPLISLHLDLVIKEKFKLKDENIKTIDLHENEYITDVYLETNTE